MVLVATMLMAAVFGAADQYLGSLTTLGPWASQVSLLSAPWLLLAFLAGCWQREKRRAIAVGLSATLVALGGYMLMTLSPTENAQLSLTTVSGFVRSDPLIFVGGLVTGPLFGWLGYRWRSQRAWLGAAVTAALLSLEPVVHYEVGRPVLTTTVAVSEVVAGLLVAGLFVVLRPRAATAAP
jgi:Family of unknown function (DUF6518)